MASYETIQKVMLEIHNKSHTQAQFEKLHPNTKIGKLVARYEFENQGSKFNSKSRLKWISKLQKSEQDALNAYLDAADSDEKNKTNRKNNY